MDEDYKTYLFKLIWDIEYLSNKYKDDEVAVKVLELKEIVTKRIKGEK
jgi:hypothetical protein